VLYGFQEHLSELPLLANSTWLTQLQHLGVSLARLQRFTDTFTLLQQQQQQQQQQPMDGDSKHAAAAAPPGASSSVAASSNAIALAVAAGILQPVVLQV
jgi:hypothetical protein